MLPEPALPGVPVAFLTEGPAPDVRLDGGPSRLRLLFPLALAMALSLTGDSTMYAVLPGQVETAGITLAVVGILLAANRIVRIPGNMVAGALFDRFGRRRLFLGGLILGAASTLSYGLVRGFWPLLGGRVLWGISWSLINVGGYTMVMDRSSLADRGRMMGLYQLVTAFGLAISPVLGGALTDAVGFRPALLICAALSAIGAVFAAVALPETRPPGVGREPARPLLWREWLKHLASTGSHLGRGVFQARYACFAVFFVNGGIMVSTLSLYVRQRWGVGISLAGQVVGVATVTGGLLALRSLVAMAAGPLAGWAADRRWGAISAASPLGRWLVVWLGLCLGVAGFLVLAVDGAAWTTAVGVALVAAGSGASTAGVAALSGDMAADRRPGVAMGSMAAAGDLGSATGPLVAYALASRATLSGLYLLCASVLITALLLCARVRSAPGGADRSGSDTHTRV